MEVSVRNEVFKVEGMTCASCSAAVERMTKKLPGVSASQVNLLTGTLNISYDEAQVTPDQIMQKVEKAGFSASPMGEERREARAEAHDARKQLDRQRVSVTSA